MQPPARCLALKRQPGTLNKIILAALVTLTPGTSTVDIDPVRRELLLHVLDSEDIETTLSAIRRDFLLPLRSLFGARS